MSGRYEGRDDRDDRAQAPQDPPPWREQPALPQPPAPGLRERARQQRVAMPAPSPPSRWPWVAAAAAVSAASAAAVVFFLVPAGEPASYEVASRPPVTGTRQAALDGGQTLGTPRLIARDVLRARTNEPMQLGVVVTGETAGTSVLLTGLPPNAVVSPGRRIGTEGWVLAPVEAAAAVVTPPQGYSGSLELGLELWVGNDRIADRRSLRVEWSGAPDTRTAAVVPTVPATQVARSLDREEIAMLMKRGEDAMAVGDIMGARLAFRRLAEARDPRGTLAYASTYDPNVIERMPLIGIRADAAQAKQWYERALEFGAPEAARRLEAIANRR